MLSLERNRLTGEQLELVLIDNRQSTIDNRPTTTTTIDLDSTQRLASLGIMFHGGSMWGVITSLVSVSGLHWQCWGPLGGRAVGNTLSDLKVIPRTHCPLLWGLWGWRWCVFGGHYSSPVLVTSWWDSYAPPLDCWNLETSSYSWSSHLYHLVWLYLTRTLTTP